MTGTTAGARPGQPPRDLTARLFRALYSQAGLRNPDGLHVAVPEGASWPAGHSMSEIARQISAVPSPGSDCELHDQLRCPQAGSK